MDHIDEFSQQLEPTLQKICTKLRGSIDKSLSSGSSKLYHGSPVWFIDDNPIVGYSKKKGGIALLFWSGQSFKEEGLSPIGKYKAAEVSFGDSGEIDGEKLAKWLSEAQLMIWDYKALIKNHGKLELLGRERK
jgi:hypothetical protein